jgi:hypothetical protein
MHDTHTNYLLSGGGDGVLRLWETAKVQEAEPPEGSNTVEIKPAVSVDLCGSSGSSSGISAGSSGGSCSSSSGRGVRGLVWLDRKSWLVQSEAGALLKVRHALCQIESYCACGPLLGTPCECQLVDTCLSDPVSNRNVLCVPAQDVMCFFSGCAGQESYMHVAAESCKTKTAVFQSIDNTLATRVACVMRMFVCVPCLRASAQVSVPLNILDQGGYSVSTLMQLQPGGVVGCATCPDRHVLLAASGDGTISAIDYRCGWLQHVRTLIVAVQPISCHHSSSPGMQKGLSCVST